MLSPLYMAEISPPEMRGSLLAMEQFSIVLGCVVGFWTGFLTRHGELLSLFFLRVQERRRLN
jgi:Sugar (and other) transporter